MRRSLAAAALMAGCVIVLAGCSSPTGIAALERNADSDDAWPGAEELLDDMDVASTRLLTETEDARYYIVASEDQQVGCLYKFPQAGSGDTAVGGCGDLGVQDQIVEVSAPETKMILVSDKADTQELEDAGWQRIQKNVLIFE